MRTQLVMTTVRDPSHGFESSLDKCASDIHGRSVQRRPETDAKEILLPRLQMADVHLAICLFPRWRQSVQGHVYGRTAAKLVQIQRRDERNAKNAPPYEVEKS